MRIFAVSVGLILPVSERVDYGSSLCALPLLCRDMVFSFIQLALSVFLDCYLEEIMSQATVTLIVAAIGIVGTLGGVWVGHLLSVSRQRKEWLRERRREEFRELMDILVECCMDIGHFRYGFKDENEQAMFEQAEQSNRIYQVLFNRIYIAQDVKRLGLVKQWSEAIKAFRKSNDLEVFGISFRRMRDMVSAAATDGV